MPAKSLVTGVAHIGIRVSNLETSCAFYGVLGFSHVAGPFEGQPVVILSHPAGVEINLIINAPPNAKENVLMDVPTKHPGYTHVALSVSDLDAMVTELNAAGVPISDGPVRFPNGARAVFVRDPDRNVVELNQHG
jgi:lactoylglutathione lyase